MRHSVLNTLLATSMVVAMTTEIVCADDKTAPGGLQLLDGWKHVPLQGIDSVVGRLERKDGLVVSYEIGRVPKPGEQFRLGGDYSNPVTRLADDQCDWKRTQTIAGMQVEAALTRQSALFVTFPEKGCTFRCTIKTPADLADVLLMTATFPTPIEGK